MPDANLAIDSISVLSALIGLSRVDQRPDTETGGISGQVPDSRLEQAARLNVIPFRVPRAPLVLAQFSRPSASLCDAAHVPALEVEEADSNWDGPW